MPPRISIHAPREGSDVVVASGQTAVTVFQSTLPARGATRDRSHGERANAYFNPRSPRGERLRLWANVRSAQRFQSTLPARGATGGVYKTDDPRNISSHAPREGSDCIRKMFIRDSSRGAWIEIYWSADPAKLNRVAPLAGSVD